MTQFHELPLIDQFRMSIGYEEARKQLRLCDVGLRIVVIGTNRDFPSAVTTAAMTGGARASQCAPPVSQEENAR